MFKTVCIKQWPEIRHRIWTYPVAALTLTVFFHPVQLVFFVVLGAFLAADLAVQVAGDDVRHRTFEFIFTRAVARRLYYTTKFIFGLLPLAGLLAFYALLEAVRIDELFWRFVAEPVGDINKGLAIETDHYAMIVPGLLLLYGVIYFLCTTSRKESAFSGYILLGGLLAGVYFFAVVYTMEHCFKIFGLEYEEAPAIPVWGLSAMAGLLLAPTILLFFIGREHYGRCELPARVESGAVSSSPWGMWLAVILVLVFIFALVLFMAPHRAAGG